MAAEGHLADEVLVGCQREFQPGHLRRHIGIKIMAIGKKTLFDPHGGLRKGTDRHHALCGEDCEQRLGVTGGAGQLPPRLTDIGQACRPDSHIANPAFLVTEIADAIHPVRPDGRRDSGAVRPAQTKHREISGHITGGDIGALRTVVAEPGQVAL